MIGIGGRAHRVAPLWRALQAETYEDQPYLFLYWMDGIVALHHRLRDADIGILSATGSLQRWWVPSDQVKDAR